MPPKRTYNNSDDDDSDEVTTSESSSDNELPKTQTKRVSEPTAGSASGGREVVNKPYDEEFDVDDRRGAKTPPKVSQATAGGTLLRNNPNDETFDVVDDRRIRTPTKGSSASTTAAAAAAAAARRTSGQLLRNNPHDEVDEVDDSPGGTLRHHASHGGQAGVPGARSIQNDHHDEAIDISDSSNQISPSSVEKKPATITSAQLSSKPTLAQGAKLSMVPRDESSDDDVSGSKASGGANAARPSNEYNPADYASINQRASREMQDLFACIAMYQPVTQELPSKLRPFIPDFIPSVGDLDPFCKIPRPDGKPDNFGLYVVDEPSSKQSNSAVVKIWLNYIGHGHVPTVFVESIEDAASRPNVIDKWVADVKELHYKKPLPTVTYSKPMPEIEHLLQVWPPDFEELLNSDVQFPPPHIDLDIEQYVRVLCTILDIPTYGSLIESLHVMFTLYTEFRANQHFQHA